MSLAREGCISMTHLLCTPDRQAVKFQWAVKTKGADRKKESLIHRMTKEVFCNREREREKEREKRREKSWLSIAISRQLFIY